MAPARQAKARSYLATNANANQKGQGACAAAAADAGGGQCRRYAVQVWQARRRKVHAAVRRMRCMVPRHLRRPQPGSEYPSQAVVLPLVRKATGGGDGAHDRVLPLPRPLGRSLFHDPVRRVRRLVPRPLRRLQRPLSSALHRGCLPQVQLPDVHARRNRSAHECAVRRHAQRRRDGGRGSAGRGERRFHSAIGAGAGATINAAAADDDDDAVAAATGAKHSSLESRIRQAQDGVQHLCQR